MANIIESLPIERFRTEKTPFYYYDIDLLSQSLAKIKECLAEHGETYNVHYAVKANANPHILQRISAEGFGADCVSGGEIEACVANGFAPEKIVFAGVGKSDEEIAIALKHDIGCFNVESVPELEVISNIAKEMGKTARVAFRINPNVDAHTHSKITTGLNENKFGLSMDDMVPAIKNAQALPNVEYLGLHFHIGSQILDMSAFENLCKRINELQDELEALGIETRNINVGGGLGIDYNSPAENPIPDFKAYFDTFAHCLKLRPGQKLHFELGRSVVGQCGFLIAKTLYVKEGKIKKFLIVDAGFTELIRPAMYQAHHEMVNISRLHDANDGKFDVVGPICESSDVFGKDVALPSTSQRGDLIAFCSAGAYGEAMASTYNCRKLPKSFFSDTTED